MHHLKRLNVFIIIDTLKCSTQWSFTIWFPNNFLHMQLLHILFHFFFIFFGFFLSFVWRLRFPSNTSWISSLIFICSWRHHMHFHFQRIDSYSIFTRNCHLMRGKQIKHFYGLPKLCKNLQVRWSTKFKTFTKRDTHITFFSPLCKITQLIFLVWLSAWIRNVTKIQILHQKTKKNFFSPPYK